MTNSKLNERFKVIKTNIPDLYHLKLSLLEDERGYLKRLYCFDELNKLMGNNSISQINHTYTKKKGSIRGMHYQKEPFCEKKIITCLKGKIFDVAIDIRINSPTFLKHFSIILTEDDNQMILIPEGFAHGFQALKDNCELLYLHSKPFNQKSEGGLNSFDPILNINWPLEVTQISDRDKNHPLLNLNFKGI